MSERRFWHYNWMNTSSLVGQPCSSFFVGEDTFRVGATKKNSMTRRIKDRCNKEKQPTTKCSDVTSHCQLNSVGARTQDFVYLSNFYFLLLWRSNLSREEAESSFQMNL